MGMTLQEVVEVLKNNDKKVQLIYAFNGTGKTRLSREFTDSINIPRWEKYMDEVENSEAHVEEPKRKILYYNAYTEDLFSWNNISEDELPRMYIQDNEFTPWIFKSQGVEDQVIKNFTKYVGKSIITFFNETYSEVKFSNTIISKDADMIKISKGEESCFVWSIFYTIIQEVISVLNIPEKSDHSTNEFDELEYIFIDDPVSSLDDNNLIELAVDLAQLIKSSESKLKFIITTHNPLFFNVLANEFGKSNTYKFQRDEYDEYSFDKLDSDSPFAYHLNIRTEILDAIKNNNLKKYHYSYLRNLIEKTSTFLGYSNWAELLPQTDDGRPNPYETRLLNILNHSKYSTEEIVDISENDKRVLKFIFDNFNNNLKFKEEDQNGKN